MDASSKKLNVFKCRGFKDLDRSIITAAPSLFAPFAKGLGSDAAGSGMRTTDYLEVCFGKCFGKGMASAVP